MSRTILKLLVLVACLAALPSTAQAQADRQPFTIVVVPDTQVYVQTQAGTVFFQDQFDWVVDQRSTRNIVFVTHEGDVAQEPASVTEWNRIEQVFSTLDADDVPYGISPGNHDIASDGSAPEYDQRFGTARYVDQPWFGGNHAAEGNRSSYQLISEGGHELLFLHLRHLQPQYGDVGAVLAWADDVLRSHPDHLVFVTTHEFTDGDGEVLFPALQALIESHCNVAAVFSGHRVNGAAAGTFDDGCDRAVHHVLTNYQTFQDGGQGFLRTVQVDPLTLTAEFRVYSPTLDTSRTGPAEAFDVQLAPLIPVPGDVTCDRIVDVGDALAIAQFSVETRASAASCPLADPATQLNTAVADIDNDGSIDVGDAVLIAQCSVGLANVFCPA